MTPPQPLTLPAPTPRLFVMSGPSGVGKDSILDRLLPACPTLRRALTTTTRPPRPSERPDVDYHFATVAEFERDLAAGAFLEHALVFGRDYYGTPRVWVETTLGAGLDVLLKIDVQGALQVRDRFPAAVLVFIAPPSWEELERRLTSRRSESAAALADRLATSRAEMERASEYDYIVVNGALDAAVADCAAIIRAERLRVHAR